jgi:hypothetical protein
LGIAACATPIAPPGGPEDTTPPRLVESVPAADAVNVDAREVVLTFSELLDAGTARRAVSITPEPETPPEIEVDRRRLTVRFREPLLDSTTYVLTLGTELTDNHRVPLARPIPFAFSTGPQLDTGRLSGTVRDPFTGEPEGDLAVFAYAAPDTLPDPRTAAPAYRTQTDADGTFDLAYLRDVPFFVIVVEDANRNRRADPGERFAVPPDPRVRPTVEADAARQRATFGLRAPVRPDTPAAPADTLAAPASPALPDSLTLPDSLAADAFETDEETPGDSASSAALTLWTTALDTIPPVPRSARALTARRVAVRFDEPVTLGEGARGWTVADSASGASIAVQAAYRLPGSPQQVVLALGGEMTPSARHLVRLDGPSVSDSAGNAAATFERAFTASSTPDTLALRVDAFVPEPSALVDGFLPANTSPGVRFSLPPPDSAYAATDTLGAPLGLAFGTDDGVTFRLADPPTRPVRLVATLPDTVLARTFQPAPETQRGALLGTVRVDSTLQAPAVRIGVEVWPAGADTPIRTLAEPGGRFSFPALPAGDYRLRFWLDVDGDGRWTGGRLFPYAPAEPLLVLRETERVRARWDTEIEGLLIERDGAGSSP